MNILIYGLNYAPELTGIGPNTAEFAEFMTARGHAVEVVTTFPFYPHWRWLPRTPLWRTERVNGVTVRRRRILLRRSRSSVWRLALDSSYAANSLLATVGAQRPSCVITIAPPIQAALVGAISARSYNCPMILWIKDLPLEAAIDTALIRSQVVVRMGRWLERVSVSLANCVVVLDEQFATNLARNGAIAKNLQTIPNWIDIKSMKPRRDRRATRSLLGAPDEQFVVLHTGNMGRKQALENVIRAAALMDGSNIRVVLTGDGPDRPILERAVATINPKNVGLMPLQAAEVYPDLLAAADLLLLNQRASVRDSVVPHKLMSYMAAGQPILGAVHDDSVAARLISKAGCGYLVAPDDPAALADGLKAVAAKKSSERQQLGLAGRQFCLEHWEKELVLGRWEKLLKRVTAEFRHHPRVSDGNAA